MTTVLVCGGGNGAHVCAAIGASHAGVTSRVLTLFEDEAERWKLAMGTNSMTVTVHQQGENKIISGQPSLVTNNPEEAMSGQVDIIVITVPSFAHEQYLDALRPYIQLGLIVVGCPGRAGFEFAVRNVLGDKAAEISIMNFESLPWACRISEFGRAVDVLGVKETLAGAAQPGHLGTERATTIFQKVLGQRPKLITRGDLLGVTMSPTNGCIHPEIMYGCWRNWGGSPVDNPPLFYNGLDQPTADLIKSVSDEVLDTAQAIMQQHPEIDLTNVEHIEQWFLRSYPDDIVDKNTLYTCIRTNKAYDGLVHPCKEVNDGKYVPNFKYRYLTEDLPYGLVVLRGIATLAGVATPNIDRVIVWGQERVGREFLIDGKLEGCDLDITRCPQKFGITSLDDMLTQF